MMSEKLRVNAPSNLEVQWILIPKNDKQMFAPNKEKTSTLLPVWNKECCEANNGIVRIDIVPCTQHQYNVDKVLQSRQ